MYIREQSYRALGESIGPFEVKYVVTNLTIAADLIEKNQTIDAKITPGPDGTMGTRCNTYM